jgi:hydrogenase nickel incorporation protein HypA/HybF
MHELSIAQSVIDSVLREMAVRRLPSIKKIVLRIGPWSGVMPDSVQFSFDILRTDTPLCNAQLIIQETFLQAHCRACRHDFEIKEITFACPQCESDQIEIHGGDELDIAYLEAGA